MTFDRETGVYEALRKDLRKFVPLPVHEGRRKGEASVPFSLGGGGGGAPTIVLAASDATDLSKSKADFQCTGTNDHDTIQAAIDLLDDATSLGRIFFTEGVYDVDFFTLKRGITLDGARAKLIKSAGTSGAMIRTDGTNFGISLVGLFLDGANIASCTGLASGAANWTRITRCVFSDWRDFGIDHDDSGTGGNPLLVMGSSFSNIGASKGTAGIRITAGDLHVVMGTQFKNLTAGVLTVGTSGLTVIGCLTKNGVTNLVESTGSSTGTQVMGNSTDAGVSTGSGVTAVHNNAAESHAGSDTDAIHDNIASEISAIAAKAVPVGGDFLVIEDSAAANVKKSVTVTALEAVIDHDNIAGVTTDDHHTKYTDTEAAAKIAADDLYVQAAGDTMTGALTVDQVSTSGAVPVLTVDQADVDEDFFKFIGTSDTSVDRALVDAVDFTTPGAIAGWLKINIQDDQSTDPITDGDYYIPFYAAPTA